MYSRSGPATPRCFATAFSPCPGRSLAEKSCRSTASSVSMSSRPGIVYRARRIQSGMRPITSRPSAAPREAGRCLSPGGGPALPSASGTPSSFALRATKGRSKPCRLWFSMTSGSWAWMRSTSWRRRPASAASPSPWASRTSVRPSGSLSATRKMRCWPGSSPVVSRSNCSRRRSSKPRSRKYVRPEAMRYCSSGGGASTASAPRSRRFVTGQPSLRDAPCSTAAVSALPSSARTT